MVAFFRHRYIVSTLAISESLRDMRQESGGGGVIVAPFLRFYNCVITHERRRRRLRSSRTDRKHTNRIAPTIICQARMSAERWRERLRPRITEQEHAEANEK